MRNAVTLSGVPTVAVRPVLRVHEQRRRAARTPQRQGEHDRRDRDHEGSGDHREAHAPTGDAHARHIRGWRRHARHSRHEVTRTRAMWEASKARTGPRTLSGRFAVAAPDARGRSPGRAVARRHLGCGRATPTSAELRGRRRAARALRLALPLGVLAAARRRLWREPRRPLRQRHDGSRRRCLPRARRRSVLRVVTAQPLPALDPAFADTRQSRAVANALCTPLVRYADAEGLPGTVIVPGLARDLPIVSRGSRTFRVQLLAGLHFADGTAPDDGGRAGDLRAAARSRDAARPAPRSSTTSWARMRSQPARARTCAACAPTAGRSRSRSSARIRPSWRAWRCRSRARSRAARRTGEVPGLLRAIVDGPLPRGRELVLADRPRGGSPE